MATAVDANGEVLPGEERIAFNPGVRHQERFLLHALLEATDQGILVSGLDRQDNIANVPSPRHCVSHPSGKPQG